MKTDLICPYCIRKLRRFAFRCESCGSTSDPDKLALGAFYLWGTIPHCKNPACGDRTLTVLCPFGEDSGAADICGQPLPSDIKQYRNYLRFSILGTTGAGKTNYLTMMIQQLRSSKGQDNPASLYMEHVDDITRTTFRDNLDFILRNKVPIGPTSRNAVVIPQLWRIRQNERPAASLTIFDGAGEDQEHPQERIVRYIYGSKQFILLIDPLSIASLRQGLTPEAILGSSHETDPDGPLQLHNGADMVASIANFIRKNAGMDVDKPIAAPVAVVFTKLDLFFDQFGNATVTRESPHLRVGCFLEADSLAVDREIRSWLIEHGRQGPENDGEEFVRVVERNFKTVRFFGVSSFGVQPTEYKVLRDIRPHRVLDPLMWLLAQDHIIPTRKPERS